MKSCNIKDFPELPTAVVYNGMGRIVKKGISSPHQLVRLILLMIKEETVQGKAV